MADQQDPRMLQGHQADTAHRLGDGRSDLGESFADPNSLDDGRLGRSFEETNSSAKKHHRPVKEAVAAPFRGARSNKVLYWILGAVVLIAVIALIVGAIPRHNRDKGDQPPLEAGRQRQTAGGCGYRRPGERRQWRPHRAGHLHRAH